MEIKDLNRLFRNEQVVTHATVKAMDKLKFARFLPKVDVGEDIDTLTYLQPEMTYEEARDKGEYIPLKPVADGAYLETLKYIKHIDKTLSFAMAGGKLRVEQKLIEQQPESFYDILKWVGYGIADKIEETALNVFMNKATKTYTQQTGEDWGDFIIESQEEFNTGDLNMLGMNSASFSSLRKELKDKNEQVIPVEDVKSYYRTSNILYQNAANVNLGASDKLDKKVVGMDLNNKPAKIFYSKHPRTTSAPSDDTTYQPILQYKKDSHLEGIPEYHDLYFVCKFGIWMEQPDLAFVGETL